MSIGTGYAITPDGRKITYAEADELQRAEIANPETTRFTAYVNSAGTRVTTWSGGELMRITEHGKLPNNWGAMIHYIRAVAPDGSQWYGRNGGPGMYINLRRAKH